MVKQETINGGASQDYLFDILRRTLRNITEDEIDVFLYYDTETALQFVDDLIDKKIKQGQVFSKNNKIDNEVRNFA